MLDRQAELGIMNSGTRARSVGFHHDEPPIDLLPPVHPGGILLADEAALGKTDAAEFDRIAFEPEDFAELRAAFGDAEAKAMLEPAGRRSIRGSKPTATELPKPRVRHAFVSGG